MRMWVKVVLAAAVVAVCVSSSDAFGRRRSAGNDCYSAPCGMAPCGMTVTWVEKEVTVMRPVMKTREVQGTICRLVTREVEVPYQYTICVPEVTPTTVKQTFYQMTTEQVPYQY